MDKKKMQFSRWFVIALSVACLLAASVLLFLPKEWVYLVLVGGALLFIGIVVMFNVLLLIVGRKKRRSSKRTSTC